MLLPHRTLRLRPVWATLVAVGVLAPTLAAQDLDDVEIETVKVTDSVYMLVGRGGNMGLSIGEDGAFLIDDQFAPLSGKILAAIRELTDQPVRFVVNTHWHGDHTGGNESFGKGGAIIVAHRNVRRRLSTEQFMTAFGRTVPPSPEAALPVITFTDSITFHWNDDELKLIHVPPAHTDGDSIIHFRQANVVHMGDTYFSEGYPFIDVDAGGSITGMIAAADSVLAHAAEGVRIIPGHGSLSDAAELRVYREMLATVRDRVRRLMDEGKSKEEVVAARPTRDLDEKWGQSFMKPDQWVGIVYDGMAAAAAD